MAGRCCFGRDVFTWMIMRVGIILFLMLTTMLLVIRRGDGSPAYSFAYSAVLLGVVVGSIQWERRYRRRWLQSRARSWRQVAGKFDEGEIVTMRKGRSNIIAGYEVWLTYEYQADGDQSGLYTLPFQYSEFPSEEEAEECRKLVAHQHISIRVSPSNPKRSCVLDDDVRPLIGR
jgi:hypothetical protein